MYPDVRDRLYTALTSGEYQQGRFELRQGDTFCFLGVLCDLYHKETGKGQWIEDDIFVLDGEQFFAGLPWDVVEWTGSPYGWLMMLTSRNDNGVTFPQLAAILI